MNVLVWNLAAFWDTLTGMSELLLPLLDSNYHCASFYSNNFKLFPYRALCNKIQAAAFDTCGCQPLFYDPDLIDQLEANVSVGDSCSICGDYNAMITIPDAVLNFHSTNTTCAEAASAAMMGQFSVEYCVEQVQPRALVDCGCILPLQPIDEAVFHNGALTTALEPTTSPSPTISLHPAAVAELSENGYICHVCGPYSSISNPDTFVTLENGITTCLGLETAGLAGFFNKTQCLEKIIPVALEESCCSSTSSPTSTPLHSATEPPNEGTPSPVQSAIKIGSQRLDSPDRYQYQGLDTIPSGNSKVVCHVCGPDKEIDDKATELVNLPEGVTTCRSFWEAGIAKVFTKSFCEDQALLLVEAHCTCKPKDSSASTPAQINGLSSSEAAHQDDPSESNVGADADVKSSPASMTGCLVALLPVALFVCFRM